MVKVIKAMYAEPKFRIRDREGKSTWRRQRAGIRQGCPLSPYLFICLMTVIFRDIHMEVDHKIVGNQVYPFDYWELMYADDTMIVGNRAREMNILLKEIERECAKYNLKLNYKKCNYIAMNGKADIHFGDGTKLEEVQSAVYLGGTLTKDGGRAEEIQNRFSKALLTCGKLKVFWSKTKCSYKWKLQVYNAIIVAQLTNGLNTLQLTEAALRRLDAFQMRGMRYITGTGHAYYSGVSNEEVIKKVMMIQ